MNPRAILFGALLGRRLPKRWGSVRLSCEERVEIRRDASGVAYIDAATAHDAWFGLGFCHSQDRAGQLELTVRMVRGTLSQVVGQEGLEVDRASRLIGCRRAASRQLETFDEDSRAQLDAYCAGINAALSSGAAPKSHEHTLLRCEPTRWEASDVVGYGLMMCCLLPSNWDAELARLIVLSRDGEAAVRALDPSYRADFPVTDPPGSAAGPPGVDFVAHDLLCLREFMGTSGGSNAWVVAGRKTASGRPLLANDPHLPASLPNAGYLVRVKCPSFAVAGISLVGIPAFISGHNGRAAWGAAAAQVDNTDLFLEELGPDGTSVREDGTFVPCETRVELIEVKGRAPEKLRVVTTRRGPIVARRSDPHESIFDPLPLAGRANAISFAATWLRPAPTRALLSMHKVQSFAEFREICSDSTGSAYSLVYADSDSIGWLLAAEVPLRKLGYGSLPMPGWVRNTGWERDVVRSDALPYAKDPEEGYLACANNKPVSDATFGVAARHESASSSNVFLGHDFLDGYRQKRISTALASRGDWTVEGTAELQLDVASVAWTEIKDVLLALSSSSGGARTEPIDASAESALRLLAAWDGNVSCDSPAASVYELFMCELCQRICRIKAPNSWMFAVGKGVMKLIPGTTLNTRRASFVARLIREQPDGYFASWPREMAEALGEVWRRLERDFGRHVEDWAWGKIRPFMLQHRFGAVRLLGKIYNVGPLAGYGDGGTVNQAGFEFWNPLRHSTVTAHFRSIIDVGNWSASRFVLLGGQSGNPLSPHYADMVSLWQAGRGVAIHWEDHMIEKHETAKLTLEPSVGSASSARQKGAVSATEGAVARPKTPS